METKANSIKLIATDLDGTLVREGTTYLEPEIARKIKELKERGIVFAAASGRQLDAMVALLKEVENDIIFISSNGAYVWVRGNIITEANLNPADVIGLIHYIRAQEGYYFMAATGNEGTFVEEDAPKEFVDWLVNGYKNEIEVVPDVTKIDARYVKFSVYNKNGVAPLVHDAKVKWGSKFRIMEAGETWLDFVDYRAEKGIALENVQKALRISKEETMVFGDNINDLGMLKKAAYSFAIGGARQEVKKAARYIADTVENNGVLQILNTI